MCLDVAPNRATAMESSTVSHSRRVATFAVLSALAVIAWHAQTSTRLRADWQTAGFIIALVVLVRPFSKVTFLSLALVEVLSVLIALPSINTNRLLQLFIFATIASTGVYVFARNGFRKLDSGEWLALFEPLLRLQLVIVYGLAAWHKLNVDFLNPQSSCAVFLFERTPFWHLRANSNTLRWSLILGTVVTEMLLPVTLSIRRTRNFAICYGALFHISLGFSEFYAFSITMMSLLFLFTPADFCDAAIELWHRRKPWINWAVSIVLLTIVTAMVILTALKFGPSFAEIRRASTFVGRLNMVWLTVGYWAWYWMLLFYLLPLGLFVWLWYRQPASFKPSAKCFRPMPLVFLVLPALLVFDGLNPYLGLKTDTAFAMYSNLRSEGGITNHLIWRHPLALANYQVDLIQIVESNNASLQAIATRGWPIPFFDLRRRVYGLTRDGEKNISVTFIRNGKTTRVEKAELDPDLATQPSLLERKLLLFRAITRQGCPH
jgi:hypothetical protein